MTATLAMFDAVTASNIPVAQATIVAGYADGLYKWSAADWARFPNAKHLYISVLANPEFPCFDSETGNASQLEVAKAVFERNRNGLRSVIYTNTSSYPTQEAACASIGVPRLAWDWWAANYSDGDVIPAGAVGVQYQGGITAPYDLSVMSSAWAAKFLGVSAPAAVPAAPTSSSLGGIFELMGL